MAAVAGVRAPTIVVLGSMCRLPVPGVVYQLLHYLLGLRRLGFDPHYVEWHGNWVADPENDHPPVENPRLPIARTLAAHGFADRWCCLDPARGTGASYGPIPPSRLQRLYRDAVAIVNVTGAHHLVESMLACPVRVYLETDPGIPQIKLRLGDPDQQRLVAAHTHHATFGELVGRDECRLPATGIRYVTTRQPVVLDLWPPRPGPGRDVTSVARWVKTKDKSIDFDGARYHWDKRRQFLTFLDLPTAADRPMRLALADAPPDDLELLNRHGWHTVDAMRSCLQLDDYRAFITDSRAEFTIAKDQYVRLRTGWFSDRSACYLAAGRPVVTQDTGFSEVMPTGAGLFAFSDRVEALAALEEIEHHYDAHQTAAHEIARAHFDSDIVLTGLLAACGVDIPTRKIRTSSRDPVLLGALREADPAFDQPTMQRLGSDRVLRVVAGPADRQIAVVAKVVSPWRARVVRHLLHDLLPGRGLSDLAVVLRSEAATDGGIWQIFEDLGDSTLARLCGDAAADEVADVGFLTPLRQAVPDQLLEAVMAAAARLHRSFGSAVDLTVVPPLDAWFLRATIGRATGELRVAASGDGRWEAVRGEVLTHLRHSAELLAAHRSVLSAAGPVTLLHGDLGPNNIAVTERSARFIDWDHAGRGPAAYDLSTLLSQLAPAQRLDALDRYLHHHPHHAITGADELDILFDLFERGRIANTVISAIRDRPVHPAWAQQRLTECRTWFDRLQPVLHRQVGAAT